MAWRCGSKVRLCNQVMEKVNVDGDANHLAHTSELSNTCLYL
jgi:hypothetical protein